MHEKVLMIGEESPLVGVLTEPLPGGGERDRPAVLILNAGTLHRVGPNRMHVNLARALAADGTTVLRFDLSGFGDSPARPAARPLEEQVLDDIRGAMDAMEALEGAAGRRFVLLGICSGAGFAFQAAVDDPRVVGAVMINTPWHVWADEAVYYRTLARHLVRIALFSSFRAKNWRKIFTLRFDVGLALRSLGTGLLRRTDAPDLVDRIAAHLETLIERDTRLLVLHSEGDEGLDYYQMHLAATARRLNAGRRLEMQTLRRANHTFSLLAHQQRAIETVREWLRTAAPALG